MCAVGGIIRRSLARQCPGNGGSWDSFLETLAHCYPVESDVGEVSLQEYMTSFRPRRHAATYGEISLEGMRSLLKAASVGEDDVFCDLGSGRGRAVLQAHLTTKARRVLGVELSAERHTRARAALDRMRSNGLGDPTREVEFCHGDMLEQDLRGVSVVYCASLAFRAEVVETLFRKLRLFTMKPMSSALGSELQHLEPRGSLPVACSWSSEVEVFSYVLNTPILVAK
ncbi:unnamed protein product [Polarella glacialis]|uniref:Histone-lysine N-methyltransferase, H3 lysine-79 specific n=1 Tax=Polarella glacialis TaxID=89957 RepID=A0A813KRS5_POLGL|nr:unnamed protein product [Polarella glacialis]